MFKLYLILILTFLLSGCSGIGNTQEQKALAERYFRGIYGCDSTVVDDLAAVNITVSYPIFQKMFNKPAIRGRDSVRHFASHFCSRWNGAKIVFHEAVAESNKVVLVWSFKASNVGSIQPGAPPSGQEKSWGGITLIRFNKAGEIEAEIGEESEPGPIERIMQDH